MREHQQFIWGETLAEREKGWFGQMGQLNASGQFVDKTMGPCNPTFRFPCVQPDKVRLIDDMKHSELNRCCVVATPITLPSWDTLAECILRVLPANREWHFGKVDHKAAV